MDWARDRFGWPLVEHSQIVPCAPHRWHVQTMGAGPDAVLLHGAGGATQSFRSLAPLLARHFRVVMMDFPGQGFTRMGARHRCGLDPVAEDIGALLKHLDVQPSLFVGHSAGAAVALTLTEAFGEVPVVGLNPALGHFEGAAAWLFPLLARTLSVTPFAPWMIARAARSPGRVEGLLRSTGSDLDPDGVALYRRLVADEAHVDATLLMMAQWSLDALIARLGSIRAQTLFCLGEKDGAVPPRVGRDAAARMQRARVTAFSGEGHLMHETTPEAVAAAIVDFAVATGAVQLSSA